VAGCTCLYEAYIRPHHEERRATQTRLETLEQSQRSLEIMEKRNRKLQKSAQERVHWAAVDKEVLGLAPRLWMEVLDEKHRYATVLYSYWRRWQLSDTRATFFEWLEVGQGSLVDLPENPRRLLEEWRVIYLKRHQQPLFRVVIENGRFLWEADRTPINLPTDPLRIDASSTKREKEVADLLRPALEKAKHRDHLLEEARKEAEDAKRCGEEPTATRLARIARPLVAEGLLCRLRDPYFEERLDAAPTPDGHEHLRAMPKLPEALLPGLDWDDFLTAIDHDQGQMMKNPFPMGEARAEGKGIFVLDSFGPLFCSTKIRGVFHHSSFVRGHCVKVAGGLEIKDGWLVELSPHSGHYQPGEELVMEMIQDWKDSGVDFSRVKMKPYTKVK